MGISDKTTPPVRYRLGAYSSGASKFPPDPKRPVERLVEGTSRFSFAQSNYRFLGWHARYFKIRVSDPDKRWLRATVEAKGFAPSIYILAPDTQIWLGHGWDHTRRKESQRTARVEGDEAEVVIIAKKADPEKIQAAALGDFVLSADFSHRDPSRGVIAKSHDFLRDPITGLITGILVTAIFSYFFHKRSIARRAILYNLVADRTVLHGDRTKESRLQVLRGGRPVSEHVGLCSVEIQFKGLKDLRAEEIVKPIQLRFNNVTSILRATAEATSGWSSITLPSAAPTSVEIPVSLLKSGDRMRLDVFYTQREPCEVEVSRGAGRFVDGDIRPARDNFRRRHIVIALSLSTFYLLPIIIHTIDLWIFQFPMAIFYLADAMEDMQWLPIFGWLLWMFWLTRGPEILNWLLGHLRRLYRPANTKESTMVHFEVEPQMPALSTNGSDRTIPNELHRP